MFITDLCERRLIEKDHTCELVSGLLWKNEKITVEIPVGFVYDGGSIPQLLWPLLPRKGSKADRAYCLHDWLYKTKRYSRKQSDEIFLEAMKSDGVPTWRALTAYTGVRAFGWLYWYQRRNK